MTWFRQTTGGTHGPGPTARHYNRSTRTVEHAADGKLVQVRKLRVARAEAVGAVPTLGTESRRLTVTLSLRMVYA